MNKKFFIYHPNGGGYHENHENLDDYDHDGSHDQSDDVYDHVYGCNKYDDRAKLCRCRNFDPVLNSYKNPYAPKVQHSKNNYPLDSSNLCCI